MLSKSIACLAVFAGSAAAFSPSMSMGVGRREVVQAGAAAAAVAPLLRNAAPAEARNYVGAPMGVQKYADLRAPVILVLDHRGCESNSEHTEYKGEKSNDENDEMCIIVKNKLIKVSEADAEKLKQEFVGMKETPINVPQISNAQGGGSDILRIK
uniref:Phycoerythrin alpha subunit L1 n=1 Tax=Chroomonas sp. M1312 TaxID=179792 RepID=A0A067XP69_9CRYP|nr:phycoerythrin alpha subunit L1 [Chroomonas sp. M1312]